MVTLNGRDFSLQGLMGRDWRLLAGLVSLLCKDEKIKKNQNEVLPCDAFFFRVSVGQYYIL